MADRAAVGRPLVGKAAEDRAGVVVGRPGAVVGRAAVGMAAVGMAAVGKAEVQVGALQEYLDANKSIATVHVQ